MFKLKYETSPRITKNKTNITVVAGLFTKNSIIIPPLYH